LASQACATALSNFNLIAMTGFQSQNRYPVNEEESKRFHLESNQLEQEKALS